MTLKRRLDQLEQRAQPVIKRQNTIRLFWIADHPGLDLMAFDELPDFGLLPGDMARAHDPNTEWDMSGLTTAQLEVLAAIPVPDGATLDDLGPGVVTEMIDYIRAGKLSYDTLADEFNARIATEAFKRAGVKP